MNLRWLVPAVGVFLFFTVAEGSGVLTALIGILTLASVAWAMSGSEYARKDHFVHGHKEGEVVPKDYRVVTSARQEPIERPWGKPARFSLNSRDEPELLTQYVSERLGPAILQHVGLVLYRDSEAEARLAETALRGLLDPIFPEPIQTRVDRWNEALNTWQPADEAGGDKAMLAALGWEARISFPDKHAARAAAARIRADGEVMVGCTLRRVTVAAADESTARTLALRHPDFAGGSLQVRRLNAFRRRRLLATLYDRQRGMSGGGWLQYDEPAPA